MPDAKPTLPRYDDAQAVVAFWKQAGPKKWFAKDDAFDNEFRRRFLDLHYAAARRELEAWSQDASSCLALILLLDQLPRNAFRGTGHMFATDPLARHYARAFIQADYMPHVDEALRVFACVPFIHSEDLADQEYALQLYRDHAEHSIAWAIDHHDIIRRFGRFPHRNACLARQTTPEEQRFLDEGGFAG